MDIDRLLQIAPVLLYVVFISVCLLICVLVVLAIVHTPREIRKNRAVLTKILSTLRSIDATLLSNRHD